MSWFLEYQHESWDGLPGISTKQVTWRIVTNGLGEPYMFDNQHEALSSREHLRPMFYTGPMRARKGRQA